MKPFHPFLLFLTLVFSDLSAETLPTTLDANLGKLNAGETGPSIEGTFRRFTNDSRVYVRLMARVGMSKSLRKREQARRALPWVEEYASSKGKNLEWPLIQGYVEAARVRSALGQTFDAASRLNRALEESGKGLARIEVLRSLSALVETQPDLEKALGYEKKALKHGLGWFKRERRVDTEDNRLQPSKAGHELWQTLKPEIEERIVDLERRIRIEKYGLDFVLYEEAQSMRKADHPSALDFTNVADAFGLKNEEDGPRVPGADFLAARKQYLEIAALFPDGVYSEASRLYAVVCLAHLGETRKALREFIRFYQLNPSGLYRGEALKLMGDLYLFANGDRRNAGKAYERAARWCETVRNQTRVMESYLVPEKSRDISAPPKSINGLDKHGILKTSTPPARSLVNRITAKWYLKSLRAEVEWRLTFLSIVEENAVKLREHMDLALSHDPVLRRQVDGNYFNAYSRILDLTEAGKPLVGAHDELRGLRRREKLLIQWADMQFMLEQFDTARNLYRRIASAAERADNGNAVARAAAGESLLLRAIDDQKRRQTVPRLLAIAERYPKAPSTPHLLYRAAFLSTGDFQTPAELFTMVHKGYPNSPYAIRARFNEILRTIPWKDTERRREEIERFIRDYPDRSDYHTQLKRFDELVMDSVERDS